MWNDGPDGDGRYEAVHVDVTVATQFIGELSCQRRVNGRREVAKRVTHGQLYVHTNTQTTRMSA